MDPGWSALHVGRHPGIMKVRITDLAWLAIRNHDGGRNGRRRRVPERSILSRRRKLALQSWGGQGKPALGFCHRFQAGYVDLVFAERERLLHVVPAGGFALGLGLCVGELVLGATVPSRVDGRPVEKEDKEDGACHEDAVSPKTNHLAGYGIPGLLPGSAQGSRPGRGEEALSGRSRETLRQDIASREQEYKVWYNIAGRRARARARAKESER